MFTHSSRLNASSSICSSEATWAMPALTITRSTPPHVAAIARNAEVTEWLSVTSSGTPTTRGPNSAASSETCLLYTSDAADEEDSVDLGGRRIIKKKKTQQQQKKKN